MTSKLHRAVLAAVCIPAFVAAACFGGGSSKNPTDASKVPTATLPATLPEVKILGDSPVQSSGASTYIVKDGDTLAFGDARFCLLLTETLFAKLTTGRFRGA